MPNGIADNSAELFNVRFIGLLPGILARSVEQEEQPNELKRREREELNKADYKRAGFTGVRDAGRVRNEERESGGLDGSERT